MPTDRDFGQANELIRRLALELEAIARAPVGSHERRRAITRYTATYAALGRLRVSGWFDPVGRG